MQPSLATATRLHKGLIHYDSRMKNKIRNRWIALGIVVVLCSITVAYYSYHSFVRQHQQPMSCKYDHDCDALDCNGVGFPPACNWNGSPFCNPTNNRCECARTCF